MSRRGIVLFLSLAVGIVLGEFFTFKVRELREQQRRERWMAFVRGPLESGGRAWGPAFSTASARAQGAALDAAAVAADRQAVDDSDDALFYLMKPISEQMRNLADQAATFERTSPSISVRVVKARAQGTLRGLYVRLSKLWGDVQLSDVLSPAETRESATAVSQWNPDLRP